MLPEIIKTIILNLKRVAIKQDNWNIAQTIISNQAVIFLTVINILIQY